MKDENTLREVIQELGRMTGKEVSKEKEDKIISAVVNDQIPKDIDNYPFKRAVRIDNRCFFSMFWKLYSDKEEMMKICFKGSEFNNSNGTEIVIPSLCEFGSK